MDPAIKKRVVFYRSELLMGHEDGRTLGPWWNLTHEQASQMAANIAPTMFCRPDLYEPHILKLASACFQLHDGFRLDPENPLQARLLLLILAHVVFGRGRNRGRGVPLERGDPPPLYSDDNRAPRKERAGSRQNAVI
jgi:hypothetical protein